MSAGRYSMRGRVFQPLAFATYALSNKGPLVVSASSGIASALRSRTAIFGYKTRTATIKRPTK